MALPRGRGREKTLYRCSKKGCNYVAFFAATMAQHESQRHVKCRCGRMFTKRGMLMHLHKIKVTGSKHP